MSPVPEPRTLATDAVTRLAEEADVQFFTINLAQQRHSEAQDHSGGRDDTHSPLVAVTTTFVTNNLNNSYDISDLVWLNQIMDKLWLPTLYEMDSHSPSPDLSHVPFFPSQLDLFRHVSAREENCLVKLQPSLEFACYNCSDSLLYDSECFWIYLEYIFVEYCPTAA